MRIVQGFDEVFRIRAVTRCSGITAVGRRIAVVPGVGVVGIVRIVVVYYPILVGLHLPDQTGDVVFHHCPGCGRIR